MTIEQRIEETTIRVARAARLCIACLQPLEPGRVPNATKHFTCASPKKTTRTTYGYRQALAV